MSPRADQPPRRGVEPRRGASRDVPAADERDDDKGRGFGGIGDARAYTPRGRTVAERDQRTRSPRAGRNADPFRPALQVLDGGHPATRKRGRVRDEPEPPRAAPQRAVRGRAGESTKRPEEAPTARRAAAGGRARPAGGRTETRGRTAAEPRTEAKSRTEGKSRTE